MEFLHNSNVLKSIEIVTRNHKKLLCKNAKIVNINFEAVSLLYKIVRYLMLNRRHILNPYNCVYLAQKMIFCLMT